MSWSIYVGFLLGYQPYLWRSYLRLEDALISPILLSELLPQLKAEAGNPSNPSFTVSRALFLLLKRRLRWHLEYLNFVSSYVSGLQVCYYIKNAIWDCIYEFMSSTFSWCINQVIVVGPLIHVNVQLRLNGLVKQCLNSCLCWHSTNSVVLLSIGKCYNGRTGKLSNQYHFMSLRNLEMRDARLFLENERLIT